MAKKNPKPTGKSGLSTSVWIAISAGLIFLGIAGGVRGWVLTRGESGPSVIKPPDFAYASAAPKRAAEAYQFAIDNPDTLAQIPCYCGCGQEAGHKSNLDCFIKSRQSDDIVFDKHAAG